MRNWYLSHLDAGKRIGKPLVFEEFGAKRYYGSLDQRDSMFKTVFDATERAADDDGSAVGGDMFWILAGSRNVPDYDGYTVYMSDSSTVQIIDGHTSDMADKARSQAARLADALVLTRSVNASR